MHRFFQAISQSPIIFPVLCATLLGLQLSTAQENAGFLPKNIVVLIDQSRSVDEGNRKSALELIAGLVEGEIPAEIRAAWGFNKAPGGRDDSDSAVTDNLDSLFQGNDKGLPIAKEPCRYLIAGLGNYQRTVVLRDRLGKELDSSGRSGLAGIFKDKKLAADYPATDNSTHVTLAEAILAERLLKDTRNRESYYLIVVSDFNEDCFNRPVSDYDNPKPVIGISGGKSLTLSDANEQVFKGNLEFDDGDGPDKKRIQGIYSENDRKSIRSFREKVEQLQLGDFNYKPDVGLGKRRVMVKVYAHSPKRSVAFTSQKYGWIYPAKAPVIAWSAPGIPPDAKLTLEIAGSTRTISDENTTIDGDTSSYSLADHLSKPLPAGDYPIRLKVEDPSEPRPLMAVANLTFVVPTITFSGKYENTTLEKPASLEHQTEIPDEKFQGQLTPPPGPCILDATLECGGESFPNHQVKVDTEGAFSMKIGDFGKAAESAVASGKPVTVTVSLPPGKILASDALASAVSFLKIEKVEIWVDGYPPDTQPIQLDLRKSLGVTFKSSHANIKGYTWNRPQVSFEGGLAPEEVKLSGNNYEVSFARNAPAGAYEIKIGMMFDGKVIEPKRISIHVPTHTSWIPILLISMGIFSLGLFGWHFFQRR